MEARRKGAKLYTIDPRRNRTGAAADKHFFINPGSDTALALAMMHVIIGENLHDADYVARYTEGFDELRRARPGMDAAARRGADRHRGGRDRRSWRASTPPRGRPPSASTTACSAASAAPWRCGRSALLPVLTGSWKEIGGGLAAFHLAGVPSEPRRAGARRPAAASARPRGAHGEHVGAGAALTALDDPPVKALVVYNSNPAAIAPNQNAVLEGLRREDLFTVVLEQFQNDTADYADYPAARHHVPGAHRPLLRLRPLLSATGAAGAAGARRGEIERGGLPPAGRAHGLRRRLLPRHGRRHDPDAARFAASVCARHHARRAGARALRAAAPARSRSCRSPPAASGRPTANAISAPETLDYTPPVESRHGDPELRRKYPLELISPKNDDSMNSTFGHRDAVDLQTATLHLNAADAAPRGIRTSDQVRVFNGRGSLRAAGMRGRYRAAGRGLRALGALGQARARQAQRQRADLRAADRRRRRAYVLQLPGAGGERMGKLKHAPRRERRLAARWRRPGVEMSRLHRPRPHETVHLINRAAPAVGNDGHHGALVARVRRVPQ